MKIILAHTFIYQLELTADNKYPYQLTTKHETFCKTETLTEIKQYLEKKNQHDIWQLLIKQIVNFSKNKESVSKLASRYWGINNKVII